MEYAFKMGFKDMNIDIDVFAPLLLCCFAVMVLFLLLFFLLSYFFWCCEICSFSPFALLGLMVFVILNG